MKPYLELKLSWDKSVKTLGELYPTEQSSIFLYAFNYQNKGKNYDFLLNKKWQKVQNNFHKIDKLTDYIQDAMFTKNSIFSLNLNKNFTLFVDGTQTISLHISHIEAVFFEQNILIISLFCSSKASINDISISLNRELRNPNFLYIDTKNCNILSIGDYLQNAQKLKDDYQKNTGKIMSFFEYFYDILGGEKQLILKDLRSGKSKYAKFITAIYAQTNQDLNDKLLFAYPQLQHETDAAINLLQVCAHHLATANDLALKDKKFEADIDFIRNNAKHYGIRLWRFWTGVAGLNSLAFLSINDGSSSIINQSKNEIYLIFLINYYVKLRLQDLDKKTIDDSFMQQNKSRQNLESLLALKAKYFSQEVADSFQPIFIDKRLKKALGIDILMHQVEDNIIKTNELTKENNSSVIAIIIALYAASQEIISSITNSIFIKLSSIFIISFLALIIWKKRNYIGKKLDFLLKKLGNF